jgi:uroporphyrinogen-III synthase
MRLAPPADPQPLEQALRRIEEFDWLIVTSGNAVTALTARVATRPPGLRVAAVGPATAAELEAAGWRVDRVGSGPGAEALVGAFAAAGDARGARVLFPASSLARDTLVTGLVELGAEVARVEAYRTLPAALDAATCFAQLDGGAVDAITFASPSAVDGLANAFGRRRLLAVLDRLAVASIGPTTSEALAALGRTPDAEASPSTVDGLADAVVVALSTRSRMTTAAGAAAGAPR